LIGAIETVERNRLLEHAQTNRSIARVRFLNLRQRLLDDSAALRRTDALLTRRTTR
jgi:hypothetical protein